MSAESAIVQETQICARQSDSDGMEVDEDDAAQLPGVPVVQADSAGFDALGSLLDVVYVARDGVTQRSVGQRACYEAVRTSSLRSFARACDAVQPIVCLGRGRPARASGGYIATNGAPRRRTHVHERDNRGRDGQDGSFCSILAQQRRRERRASLRQMFGARFQNAPNTRFIKVEADSLMYYK